MNSIIFLQQREKDLLQIIKQAAPLCTLDIKTLQWRAKPDSWNTLECVEHMNRYGKYYIPQLENAIQKSNTHFEEVYHSGRLGQYFAQSMLPAKELNKMKTFKSKNPISESISPDVVNEFLLQQNRLLSIVKLAYGVNLQKVKIPTTLSSLLRLRLGDTLAFVINHEIRHMQQIDQLLAACPLHK